MWSPFIILVVPLLILSSFFSDLIVSLSSLVFLIYVFRKKDFYYFNKKPLIIFFIFCLYCILLSIFVAKDTLFSFESSLFYFRIGLFACVIWYSIEKNKNILNYFYYAFVFCFFALLIDGYIQFFIGYNILGYPKSGERISSFFGNELIMGSYLSRFYPLLFALFLIRKKKKLLEVYSMSILFVFTSCLIYVTGERNAFFFNVLSLIFIIILVKQFFKLKLIIFVSSLIIITIINLSFPKIKTRMISDPSTTLKMSIFTPQHDSLIRTSYKMFLDKPIFGHGPKMFRILCKDEKYSTGLSPCSTHPHNFYLQLLAETGIIGFSFLFSLFIYVLYCFYRQVKSKFLKKNFFLTDYQVCLLVGILITVWPFTTNGNFFHNWLVITYSLPAGFYLQSIYSKN